VNGLSRGPDRYVHGSREGTPMDNTGPTMPTGPRTRTRPTTRASMFSQASSREGSELRRRGEDLVTRAERLVNPRTPMSERSIGTPLSGSVWNDEAFSSDHQPERVASPPLHIPENLVSYTFERGTASTLRKVRDSYTGRHVNKGQGLNPDTVCQFEPQRWSTSYSALIETPSRDSTARHAYFVNPAQFSTAPDFYSVKYAGGGSRSERRGNHSRRSGLSTAPPMTRANRGMYSKLPNKVMPLPSLR